MQLNGNNEPHRLKCKEKSQKQTEIVLHKEGGNSVSLIGLKLEA